MEQTIGWFRAVTFASLWATASLCDTIARFLGTIEYTITVIIFNFIIYALDINEFRLDCGRVDALVVEEFFHFLCYLHVVDEVSAANVSWRDNSVTCQLPHMEFVYSEDTVNLDEEEKIHEKTEVKSLRE